MLIRFAAAIAACLLFIAPASAACQRWEDGVRSAAEWSAAKDDRVAAVLLTPEESAATWAVLFPGEPGPYAMGVMVAQSDPEKAFIVGFDPNGCVVGSGSLPFGPVIDAMVTAGVKSEFVIIEPAAPTEGA